MTITVRPASPRLPTQFLESLRQPEFWAYSSWLDVATRHRRTTLGFFWFLMPTIMFLLVLGNVYSHLMRHPAATYLPYLGAGYVTWRFILQVIHDSVATFSGHKPFIMDGRTRLTDFILRSFAKASYQLVFGFIVVAAVLVWSPDMQAWRLLTLFVSVPVLCANLAWIAVCLALLGARYREFHEVLGTVLMVGFLLTPVLWTVDRFPPDSVRGMLVRLNPAYHMIEIVRAPVLGHPIDPASLLVVAGMLVIGWPLASFAYRRYARFVPIWI